MLRLFNKLALYIIVASLFIITTLFAFVGSIITVLIAGGEAGILASHSPAFMTIGWFLIATSAASGVLLVVAAAIKKHEPLSYTGTFFLAAVFVFTMTFHYCSAATACS